MERPTLIYGHSAYVDPPLRVYSTQNHVTSIKLEQMQQSSILARAHTYHTMYVCICTCRHMYVCICAYAHMCTHTHTQTDVSVVDGAAFIALPTVCILKLN